MSFLTFSVSLTHIHTHSHAHTHTHTHTHTSVLNKIIVPHPASGLVANNVSNMYRA